MANLLAGGVYSDGTGTGGKQVTGLNAAVPTTPAPAPMARSTARPGHSGSPKMHDRRRGGHEGTVQASHEHDVGDARARHRTVPISS